MEGNKWFVLNVKRGEELKIKEWFDKLPTDIKEKKGVLEISVPTQTVYKVKNNRNVHKIQPKLPKYIFLKLNVSNINLEDPAEISNKVKDFFAECPYNLFFVKAEDRGGDKSIYYLTQKEIDKLINNKSDTGSTTTLNFCPNEKVKIIDGPFTGITGTIIGVKNTDVKLKITIFSRDVEIVLSSAMLSKI